MGCKAGKQYAAAYKVAIDCCCNQGRISLIYLTQI